MRIIIDLQGAQNNSRNRGIGRYTLSLAEALVKERGNHEVIILLSAVFSETIAPLRSHFEKITSPDKIVVWHPLSPTDAAYKENHWRRDVSELLYEKFIESLKPDALIICSHFEGLYDGTITSIHKLNRDIIIAPVLHDLIPLTEIERKPRPSSWGQENVLWYFRKLAELRRADVLLSNSDSSKAEAIQYLSFPKDRIVNISAAAHEVFQPLKGASAEHDAICSKYGILKPFVLTAARVEERKNPEGLIKGFALLPKQLRHDLQLVFIGEFDDWHREKLFKIAKRAGLEINNLVFTGYIKDADLAVLYGSCAAFVFPTYHEGFGLPALEAMACGAPTIASNTSSLPEVVGFEEALFDPADPNEISLLLQRVLTNTEFRKKLVSHGLEQSQKFTWAKTAQRAISALEYIYELKESKRESDTYIKKIIQKTATLMPQRPRLAFVTPLPGVKHPAVRFAANLLLHLGAYYEIDVIVDQAELEIDQVLGGVNIRGSLWFSHHAHEYERIVYYVANSKSHSYVLSLLDEFPGIVILHDFFLGKALVGLDSSNVEPAAWIQAIVRSHGWHAFLETKSAKQDSFDKILSLFPANWSVLNRAYGIIVHTEQIIRLNQQWYGVERIAPDWSVIPPPLVRRSLSKQSRGLVREELGLDSSDFVVYADLSAADATLVSYLLNTWRTFSKRHGAGCRLLLADLSASDDKADIVRESRRALTMRQTIRIVESTDAGQHKLPHVADLVLLLSAIPDGSISETLFTALEHGVPVVCDTNIAVPCIYESAVVRFTAESNKLLLLFEEISGNHLQFCKSVDDVLRTHQHADPNRKYAELYVEAIEGYSLLQRRDTELFDRIAELGSPDLGDMSKAAEMLSRLGTGYLRGRTPQLLVDVSELARTDAGTGIQRVTRSVLHELFQVTLPGYRVEPVYMTVDHGYRYARQYTARFLDLNIPSDNFQDDPIFYAEGDIFWGLDVNPGLVSQRRAEFEVMRSAGVNIVFTLHDILPLTLPQTYGGPGEDHAKWLETLAWTADGILAVSKHSMHECKRWLDLFGPKSAQPVKLGWVHNGSDIIDIQDSRHNHAQKVLSDTQLDKMFAFPTFLMVGTLEPRMGHRQVVEGFSELWRRDVRVNLVIVGKQGWLADELVTQLRGHPMRERYLFWLERIDDEALQQVYLRSTCLIAASLDEGFGQPLVEAARYGLPVLARDIPVFREVAGDHAYYFDGFAPIDLATAVERWLRLDGQGRAPQSHDIPRSSWRESTITMLDVILNNHWVETWRPKVESNLIARFWGSDYRLGTIVGERVNTTIQTTGQSGHLIYGPYLSLPPGDYRVIVYGKAGSCGGNGAKLTVWLNSEKKAFAEKSLVACTSESSLISLPFCLNERVDGLEFLIYVDEYTDLIVESLEVLSASGTMSMPSTSNKKITQPKSHVLAKCWWATHPHIHHQVGYTEGRSVFSTGVQGTLIYGPYVSLPSGAYTVTFHGKILTENGNKDVSIDVAMDSGRVIIMRQEIENNISDNILGSINYELSEYADNIEFRVHVGEHSSIRVDYILVEERL